MEDLIKKKIFIAEKRILQLLEAGDLKSLSEQEKYNISSFYETKSKNRLESARIIYKASNKSKTYMDYAEVVAAAYYSMYYIVHAFVALKYRLKIKESLRGVHAITEHLILKYMVKTGILANKLYQDYIQTFHTAAEIQKIPLSDFQIKAYEYAKKYDRSREAREIFTYNITPNIEARNAQEALEIAEEFINTIRQLMI